jgi:hypothetical protein
MNASSAQADAGETKTGPQWRWAFLGVLMCFAAITHQSLWNDEALTAVKAMQPSLHDWWHEMLGDKASDLQMPLYMIYMWGFAKLSGTSEWALRCANIPWFVTGLWAFMRGLTGPKKMSLAFIVLLSPFAWYYIGEARPYAMQLGASLMIFAALYRLGKDKVKVMKGERGWVLLFLFGVVSLSGSSLLGMIWAGAGCLAAGFVLGLDALTKLVRTNLVLCLISFFLLAGLAGYYLWTLQIGARASDVGRTDARNLVFIIYELLGFGGLGPGRLEIREEGWRAFLPFAKSLFIYGMLILDLLVLGGWRICREQTRTKLCAIVLIIVLPMVTILGAGYVKEFRVLGRHFTPLLPVILFILWVGLQARWSRPHWASRPLAIGFVILTLASCLSVRFAARHERDDYRDAAGFAKAALETGREVWWNAGREGAVYYELPLAETPNTSNAALWLMNPTVKMLQDSPSPEIVITSKPDVYDGNRIIAEYLAQGNYTKVGALPAFIIWQRKTAFNASPQQSVHGEFD